MVDPDKWIEISKDCKYLPENELKQLCDIVCDLLMEESNIQVQTIILNSVDSIQRFRTILTPGQTSF